MLSVVIATLIYVGLQIGMVGALDGGSAGLTPGNWGGLNGSNWGGNPLVVAMFAAGLGSTLVFANFLLVDAGISPSDTGWIYLGTSARASYGLGVNGYGPKQLQRHNRWGIPWISLLIAFVVGCVPWGTLVAAAIGLIGFYWGSRSGFYTEQMREIVEAHQQEQEEKQAA